MNRGTVTIDPAFAPYMKPGAKEALEARAGLILADSVLGTDAVTLEILGLERDYILSRDSAQYLHDKLAMILGLPCDGLD